MNLNEVMGGFDYRFYDIFRILEGTYKLPSNSLSTLLITGNMDSIVIKPTLVKNENGTLNDIKFEVEIKETVKEDK